MLARRVVYSEPQDVYVDDVINNRIAEKMSANFEDITGHKVSDSERRSWVNSQEKIKNLIELGRLKDIFVTLEFQVPYRQERIDCLLYGKDHKNKGYVVHIELKQWDKVKATHIEGNFEDKKVVETHVGKPNNVVSHPSQQVKGYNEYLIGFIEVLEEGDMGLFGCAYCFNYQKKEGVGLFDDSYKDIISEYPLYSANDASVLAGELRKILQNGGGFEVFNRFMQSPVKPSKKLLESASKIVSNSSDFSLLNDQIVARNVIVSKIRSADKNNEKSVILIKGGPGTGKTVIALHILAEMAGDKKKRSIFFSTKSKPLLEGIKNKLGRGSQAKLLFTNLSQFIPSRVEENSVDILLVDEAHRIGKSPNSQYTRADDRTDLQQIDTLIRAAKTSIFFIDDKQVIRSMEIGSTKLIIDAAEKYNCTIEEVDLVSQFRCNGSDNYLDWLESVLGHTSQKRVLTEQDNYDFRIYDTADDLYSAIIKKNDGQKTTSRLVAGFCWEWSKTLDENGDLVKDVRIGNFAMPWETHGEITRPPAGYVKWYEWAYKPEGIKQVGCIYTVQGFEFDYIGVIIGPDLKYDAVNDRLYADISATKDPMLRRGREGFDNYVKNIYRVLMSRGMKGCYIYCLDEDVKAYLKNRISKNLIDIWDVVKEPQENYPGLNLRILLPTEVKPFVNAVPLYDLKVAAGGFSEYQQAGSFDWVELPEPFTPKQGYFVVQVIGESMNKKIPNGSWCLFRAGTAGSRNGKVVLVQHRSIQDAEMGGHYTVKTYHSEKSAIDDGSWRHSRITLSPNTTAHSYKDIILMEDAATELFVVGELVAVLG